jgi:hypothetical protein
MMYENIFENPTIIELAAMCVYTIFFDLLEVNDELLCARHMEFCCGETSVGILFVNKQFCWL